MVSGKTITVYVEGGSPAHRGVGPDPAFRKAFNKLFSQAEGVRVKIVMIGPIGNAPKKLAEITKQNSPDVVLVDLDKTAPDLIMHLKLDKLQLDFEDVEALVEYLT